MNNIFKLVSNYFRMFFAKIFKNSKRKLATYTIAIIVLIVGLVFSFIFTLLSYYNISNAIKLEVPEIAIYSFATTMIMFAFVLIITESGNNMKATDEELLLSLPINKRDIVISKILYFILCNGKRNIIHFCIKRLVTINSIDAFCKWHIRNS